MAYNNKQLLLCDIPILYKDKQSLPVSYREVSVLGQLKAIAYHEYE